MSGPRYNLLEAKGAEMSGTEHGWYVARGDATEGPIAWNDLARMAHEGAIGPSDRVFHESRGTWEAASAIPGLFAAAAPQVTPQPAAHQTPRPAPQPAPQPAHAQTPTPQPAPQSAPHTAAAPQSAATPRRKRSPLALVLVALGALVVLAIAIFGIAAVLEGPDTPPSDPETPAVTTDYGEATYTDPGFGTIVETDEWGPVPADNVHVVLSEGSTRADADAVAAELGAEVVGELEGIRFFQLRTSDATAEQLAATLAAAEAHAAVELAFADTIVVGHATAVGVPCTPLSDAAYAKDGGRPQEMIGAERAWAYIRASGLELRGVHVGVSDTPIVTDYAFTSEFSGASEVRTLGQHTVLAQPYLASDGNPDPSGSHAGGVTTVIAGNPDDGGPAGLASTALRDKLSVTVEGSLGGIKAGIPTWNAPDWAKGDDAPVTYERPDGTFAAANLIRVHELVQSGATVINLSWGTWYDQQNSQFKGDPRIKQAYERYFRWMAEKHPEVLFVTSAGNDAREGDPERCYPEGIDSPNLLTIGCLDNDGSRRDYSNKAGGTDEDPFLIQLAAPGHGIVRGVGKDGSVQNTYGGTSMAAPQVAATAALLRSLDPSLSAKQIAEIIVSTGRTQVDDGAGGTTSIPQSVGGRCLAIDEAVRKVINDRRAALDLPPLDDDLVAELNRIDLSAESEDGIDWTVSATFEQVPRGGIEARASAEGGARLTDDDWKGTLEPGTITWTATTEGDGVVHVTRLDTNACWRVALGGMAGTYEGFFRDVFDGGATIDVPVRVVIGSDGSAEGSWSFEGEAPVGVSNVYRTTGTFTGSLSAEGVLRCTGVGDASITAGGVTSTGGGTHTIEGTYTADDDSIVGTFTGETGKDTYFEVTRVR